MKLEDVNKKYVQLKADLQKANTEVMTLEKNVSDLAEDKMLYEADKILAKRSGNIAAEQIADRELARVVSELQKAKKDAEEKKSEILQTKQDIERVISAIKENPMMKQHLNEVLKKRYERQIKKVEKEKEDLKNKKEKISKIQELTEHHPSLSNNLKGILGATKEIKDLEKELKELTIQKAGGLVTYTNPVRANTIRMKLLPEAKNKVETNKNLIMSYIQKNNLDIKEEDIMEFADRGCVQRQTKGGANEVDLEASFKRYNKSLERQIKGRDKSITDHTRAMQQKDEEIETATREGEDTPKRWQIFKRFRNWLNRRRQPAIPEHTTPNNNDNSRDIYSNNVFRDSLKYEVVREAADKMKEQELKSAKQSRKEAEIEEIDDDELEL